MPAPTVGPASDPARPARPLILAFDESPGPGRPRWVDRFGGAGPADAHWVSLVDPDRGGFYGGIAGLGASVEATVAALQAWIVATGPAWVVTCGAGVGGHAALVHGVLLGVDRIVVVEPLAHLVADVLLAYHDRRRHRELVRLPEPDVARRYDVYDLMGRVGYAGEVHILLGSRPTNPHLDAVHLDAIHAEWLARSPRVAIHRFDHLPAGLLDGTTEPPEVRALVRDLLAAGDPGPPRSPDWARSDPGRRPSPRPARLTLCRIGAACPANRTGRPVEYAAVGELDLVATAAMTDDLRSWIVENLHLEASSESLAGVLAARGVSRREAFREIGIARAHPYVRAARAPLDRLAKRDWLLSAYRRLDHLRRRPFQLDRRARLDSDEFARLHLATGRPVLLTELTADWPALRTWDFAHLARRSGQRAVVRDGVGAADGTTSLAEFLATIVRPGHATGPTLTLVEGSANDDLWAELRRDLGPFAGSARGAAWFGPAGAMPPPTRPADATLVAQVTGRTRAELILLWDVAAAEDDRSPVAPIGASGGAAADFPPVGRPELIELTLEPGDLLFVPPGCRCRFEAVDPAALVAIPLPIWSEHSGRMD